MHVISVLTYFNRLSAVVEEDEGESSSSCESDSDNLPRLEMSELLKVGMKTKEILPKLIIDEMYVIYFCYNIRRIVASVANISKEKSALINFSKITLYLRLLTSSSHEVTVNDDIPPLYI